MLEQFSEKKNSCNIFVFYSCYCCHNVETDVNEIIIKDIHFNGSRIVTFYTKKCN